MTNKQMTWQEGMAQLAQLMLQRESLESEIQALKAQLAQAAAVQQFAASSPNKSTDDAGGTGGEQSPPPSKDGE